VIGRLKQKNTVAMSAGHNDDDLSPLDDGMDKYFDLIDSSSAGGGDAYIYSQIEQALSHNRIYNGFADILASSAAQVALNKDEAKATSIKHTLELFAFGTIDDYVMTRYNNTEDRNYYLELTEKQISKLRRLSVVSLVRKLSLGRASEGQTSPKTVANKKNPSECRTSIIPYAALLRDLHLDFSVGGSGAVAATTVDANNKFYKYGALEELLTECIYNRLLTGGHSHKLDQRRKCLHLLPHPNVHLGESLGLTRDVNVAAGAGDIDRMAEQLKHLIQQSGSVITTLEGIAAQSKQQRDCQQMVWTAVHKTLEEGDDDKHKNNSSVGEDVSSALGMDFASGGDGAGGGGGGNSRRDNSRRSKRRHPGAFLGVGGGGGNFRS
jgi:hypothetical protein